MNATDYLEIVVTKDLIDSNITQGSYFVNTESNAKKIIKLFKTHGYDAKIIDLEQMPEDVRDKFGVKFNKLEVGVTK